MIKSSASEDRVWNLSLSFLVSRSRRMEEREFEGSTMSAGETSINFEYHNIQLPSVAVSATIPWQEGKEEDFAELREGLR